MLTVNQVIALILILFCLLTTTGVLCYRLGRRVGALEKQEEETKQPAKPGPIRQLVNNLTPVGDPIVPGRGGKK